MTRARLRTFALVALGAGVIGCATVPTAPARPRARDAPTGDVQRANGDAGRTVACPSMTARARARSLVPVGAVWAHDPVEPALGADGWPREGTVVRALRTRGSAPPPRRSAPVTLRLDRELSSLFVLEALTVDVDGVPAVAGVDLGDDPPERTLGRAVLHAGPHVVRMTAVVRLDLRGGIFEHVASCFAVENTRVVTVAARLPATVDGVVGLADVSLRAQARVFLDARLADDPAIAEDGGRHRAPIISPR